MGDSLKSITLLLCSLLAFAWLQFGSSFRVVHKSLLDPSEELLQLAPSQAPAPQNVTTAGGIVAPQSLLMVEPQAPTDLANWTAWIGEWIHTHGKPLGQRSWFDDDDYQVAFDEVVLPDGEGPCSVTFIATPRANGDLVFNLYSVQVLNQLLSRSKLPQISDMGENGKVWGQTLGESQCLSMSIRPDGVGHIHDVGTRSAQEYGGCGCFNRGKSLVQLADLMACRFKQKRMALIDSSSIQCREKPEVTAPLGFYYVLKTGRTWYQSFAYEHEDSQIGVQKKLAAESARATGNKPLDWSPLDWSSSPLRTPLSLYQAHLGGQKDKTNRDFALWVWEKDCSQWAVVVEAIFGNMEAVKNRFWGVEMSKPLVCDRQDSA